MKKFSKIFSLALVVMTLMLLITSTVYAEEYVKWTISEDGKTISDGTTTYTLYTIYDNFETRSTTTFFRYENNIKYQGTTYTIYSNEKGGDIVELFAYNQGMRIYVSKQGKKILDNLFDGDNVRCKIWDDDYYAADIDFETLAEIRNDHLLDTTPYNIDVRELDTWECYDVTLHDELLYMSYTAGAVYKSPDNTLYYLDYTSLGNQHFDANGNFSYRSGVVSLYKLRDNQAETIKNTLKNTEYMDSYTVWEDAGLSYTEEEAISLTPLFYVGLILLGFVFPLPFLVMGIVFPRVKKFGKPKYWYILAIASGVWIATALAFTLLVFLA